MSEEKKDAKIEGEINEKLSGDALKNALDFVAYMRSNEMPSDPADYSWFKYSNENICVIMIDDAWSIYWSDCDIYCDEQENTQAYERLKEFAQSHINPCARHEGAKGNPGRRKSIFGEVSSENLCTSTLCFDNPSAEELESIKKLAKMRKQNIADMQHQK